MADSCDEEDLVSRFTPALRDMELIDADCAIDDARRYLWLRATGASDAELMDMINGNSWSSLALAIAKALTSTLTLNEADVFFLRLRRVLWEPSLLPRHKRGDTQIPVGAPLIVGGKSNG